jgi:hypothetical protein
MGTLRKDFFCWCGKRELVDTRRTIQMIEIIHFYGSLKNQKRTIEVILTESVQELKGSYKRTVLLREDFIWLSSQTRLNGSHEKKKYIRRNRWNLLLSSRMSLEYAANDGFGW